MSTKLISAAEVSGFQSLTLREQQFVQHPDVYRDPKKAAMEVGYSSSTVEKRAHSMRQRLMRFIQPVYAAQLAAIGVDRRRVEAELACIAFTDINEFKESIDIEMKDGGFQTVVVWKHPSQLTPDQRRAIRAVEFGTTETADEEVIQSDRPSLVVLYSKEKALHELAGLFGDVAPSNPVDDQQGLFDHLDLKEREVLVKLYAIAAKRAAGAQSMTEGTHAHRNEAVPRLEAPSTPSDDRERRGNDQGREVPRDKPVDVEQPAPVARVRGRGQHTKGTGPAPRRGRATAAVVLEDDGASDVGFRELP